MCDFTKKEYAFAKTMIRPITKMANKKYKTYIRTSGI